MRSGVISLVCDDPAGREELVGCMIDITAEKALAESERHFRRIVEDNPLPINMADVESGLILYQSRAAGELFGYDWPSSEPRYAVDHWANPEDRANMLRQVRKTAKSRL